MKFSCEHSEQFRYEVIWLMTIFRVYDMFIAKMQIALKECHESEYRLELLNRTGYIPDEQYNPL